MVLYNRLKKKKTIEVLFSKGLRYKTSNYKFLFTTDVENSGVEVKKMNVLFSVPKKRISLAVDRNKIKRRTRNALNEGLKKNPLLGISCAIIYTRSHIISFEELQKDLEEFLIYLKPKEKCRS